jgi:hypothetical protein
MFKNILVPALPLGGERLGRFIFPLNVKSCKDLPPASQQQTF